MALALTAALAVTITAGYAVIQAVFSIETGYCRAKVAGGADGCWREDTAIRVVGTSSNPNLLAPAMVLLIPIGGAALRLGRQGGCVGKSVVGRLGTGGRRT